MTDCQACGRRDESYNGWSNYETWTVKLHWDNNQGDYRFFSDMARIYLRDKRQVHELADALSEVAEEIKVQVIEGRSTQEAKLFISDVGSLWRVNWHEIATAYLEEARESLKEASQSSAEVGA